ncbi:MAG: phosphodiesterase [Flaviaesturariibacter sp.]|nr:phosphodiesterase [Flaviaesturariibacter sp.]
MNYLAHAYLSFNHPRILVGNMISDFVKGRGQFTYERQIQMGIRLHRQIDEYTDHHPATAAAKEFFRADYRLYSGAIIDVLYDHFLANDPSCFASPALLDAFAQKVYSTLTNAGEELPAGFAALLPYMRAQNWLYRCHTREGAARSLEGLVRRAAYINDAGPAIRTFSTHHQDLQACYNAFIGDVKSFANEAFGQLLS